MIKVENIDVYGFEHAIRGMRNPLNSWNKSDSFCNTIFCNKCSDSQKCSFYFSEQGKGKRYRSTSNDFHYIGPNDLKLMKSLIKAGTDHSKFMRMINVTMDITAPLYWWKEFDTYKVGTVANSCSTMHKIHNKEFILEDFSHEHLDDIVGCDISSKLNYCPSSLELLKITITMLNHYREVYIETKDKDAWWQMIQLLPSSYNQKRTIQLNYQVLRNIYFSRKNHKLDEWVEFCKIIETLPYAKKLVCLE